jgi:ABC-type molybdate transport system substrate-binding protein
MILRRHFLLALAVLGLGMPAVPAAAQDKTITVSPPASMKNALDDINAAFLKATRHQGGRRAMRQAPRSPRQLEQGAPADIFASGRPRMDGLQRGKKTIRDDTARQPLWATGWC